MYMRFLDLELTHCPYHVCWEYKRSAQAGVFLYDSTHSKLVKGGIARSCRRAAFDKSCTLSTPRSFEHQVTILEG